MDFAEEYRKFATTKRHNRPCCDGISGVERGGGSFALQARRLGSFQRSAVDSRAGLVQTWSVRCHRTACTDACRALHELRGGY